MFLITFISLLLQVLFWAIFARVMISWVDPQQRWAITRILNDVTEPILAPARKVIPSAGMFDLSPMIVLLVIQLILAVL
jgi:YggT family protein